MSGSNAQATALRLLTIRDRSEAELAERLRRKGFAEAAVAEALQRCRELGYLDNRRYAAERARFLLRSGRAVGPRILADLKSRGIAEPDARAALEEASREYSEQRILADALARRFAGFSYHQADDRERRRVVNYFQRRGFPASRVLAFLKESDER